MQILVSECRQCPVMRVNYDTMIGYCKITKLKLFASMQEMEQLDQDKFPTHCPMADGEITLGR